MTLFMVELTVADFAHSVAWYRDALGLTVELVDESNGFAMLVPGASSRSKPEEDHQAHPLQRVGFAQENSGRVALKRGTPSPTTTRLHFLVPDLTAELARLAALDVHPDSDPKTSDEGYRRATFRDLDGYAVSLFEWITSSPTPSHP
jgi:catechol 2,3-dioxygenase-like lactoylglutathione lyase family enzyme